MHLQLTYLPQVKPQHFYFSPGLPDSASLDNDNGVSRLRVDENGQEHKYFPGRFCKVGRPRTRP